MSSEKLEAETLVRPDSASAGSGLAPPIKNVSSPDRSVDERPIDLKKLAEAQSTLVYGVTFSFFGFFAMLILDAAIFRLLGVAVLWIGLGLALLCIWAFYRVCRAYAMGGVSIFVVLLVSLTGLFTLPVMVLINRSVTRMLKAQGCEIGLMGIRPPELRKLQQALCMYCGYNLDGLPSRKCPECGEISPEPGSAEMLVHKA